MSNLSVRVGFDAERSIAGSSFDGTNRAIGTPLEFNPAVMIFDNQTNADVPVNVNQGSTWKTFSPGEAFVLDLRANNGIAANYTVDLGTQFYTNASTVAGITGSFRISLIYAR